MPKPGRGTPAANRAVLILVAVVAVAIFIYDLVGGRGNPVFLVVAAVLLAAIGFRVFRFATRS